MVGGIVVEWYGGELGKFERRSEGIGKKIGGVGVSLSANWGGC